MQRHQKGRGRGRPALWELSRDEPDYFALFTMLSWVKETPIRPYALARKFLEWHPQPGDELMHIKRLGNKLKALLSKAKGRTEHDRCIAAMTILIHLVEAEGERNNERLTRLEKKLKNKDAK